MLHCTMFDLKHVKISIVFISLNCFPVKYSYLINRCGFYDNRPIICHFKHGKFHCRDFNLLLCLL